MAAFFFFFFFKKTKKILINELGKNNFTYPMHIKVIDSQSVKTSCTNSK